MPAAYSILSENDREWALLKNKPATQVSSHIFWLESIVSSPGTKKPRYKWINIYHALIPIAKYPDFCIPLLYCLITVSTICHICFVCMCSIPYIFLLKNKLLHLCVKVKIFIFHVCLLLLVSRYCIAVMVWTPGHRAGSTVLDDEQKQQKMNLVPKTL